MTSFQSQCHIFDEFKNFEIPESLFPEDFF